MSLAPRSFVVALSLLAVLSTAVSAQSTFIVDVQNRPGTDFTDLPLAIRTVVSGDTLIVRDGTYVVMSPIELFVFKGIQIHFQAGAKLQGVGAQVTFSVLGIPAGESFVVRGPQLQDPASGMTILTAGCDGAVVIEDIVMTQPGLGVRIQATDSDHVIVRRVNVAGHLKADDSAVSITQSVFDASLVASLLFIPIAANLTDSTAELADSLFLGGSVRGQTRIVDYPGVRVGRGRTWIRRGTRVVAGTRGVGSPAVDGTGPVVVDPSVILAPSGGRPRFGNNVTVTTQELSKLRSGCAPIGGTLQIEMAGAAQDPYLLVVGLPKPPTAQSNLGGRVWVDFPEVLATGLLDAGGAASLSVAIPNDPLLQNFIITFQLVTPGTLAGTLALSNPSSVCFTP